VDEYKGYASFCQGLFLRADSPRSPLARFLDEESAISVLKKYVCAREIISRARERHRVLFF
jgi:hypothetical protein